MKNSLTLICGALAALALNSSLFASPKKNDAPDPKKVVDSKESGIDAAKLWGQTCSRCHNARPANTYSDAQWVVIMQHMRTRASLTGEEARAILTFLQEAN